MNMSHPSLALLFLLCACGELLPNPENMPVDPDSLPTWDSVNETTHTKATRPPEPVLIVDRKDKECFKVYSVFPQEYRLPNGQAYSIRDCSAVCGTPILCPSWAQDVQTDWSKRKERDKAIKEAPKTPAPAEPDITTNSETAPAKDTPEDQKNWPANLGPPPTEEPTETDNKPTPKDSDKDESAEK